MVENLIKSMKHLDYEFDFIIHDNGSDDIDTINTLVNLEKEKIASVIYKDKISSADDLNNTDDTINYYFSNSKNNIKKYVVTDCDIDLSTLANDAIQVFSHLLDSDLSIDCVGPMLTIKDIPKTLPLFNHVMNRHIDQFWKNTPQFINSKFGQLAIQRCLIDTTFAIHRREQKFSRLKKAIRVYTPYEAKHLDWYINNQNSIYKTSSDQNIAHWSNEKFIKENNKNPLLYEKYYVVEQQNDGRLVPKTVFI